MNIFGYNPFKSYRGRGAFETMGAGIDMTKDEIAFKCNFSHLNKVPPFSSPQDNVVVLRRVDREFDRWGLSLIDELNKLTIPGHENYKVTVQHANEHRCGIKISVRLISNPRARTSAAK